MSYIASTRFNNSTLKQNMDYRQKMDIPAIYGPGFQVNTKYPIGAILFVFEMNNDENRIEGVSLVLNKNVFDVKHKIYEDSPYNRFIYRSNYWISRETLLQIDSEIVEIFDKILFKGKTHVKRQTGITIVTEKIFLKWQYDMEILKRRIKDLFYTTFNKNTELNLNPELNTELNLNPVN